MSRMAVVIDATGVVDTITYETDPKRAQILEGQSLIQCDDDVCGGHLYDAGRKAFINPKPPLEKAFLSL